MVRLIKIIIVFGLLCIAGFWLKGYLLSPVNSGNNTPVNITIPENSSVIKIGTMLENAGIIRNNYVFKYYVRYRKLDAKLQAGNYNLSPAMPLSQVADTLLKADKERLIFTIPEGYTVKQIAKLLADKGIVNYDKFLDITLNNKYSYSFLNYSATLNNPLEGYLFPDTYYIPKDFGEKEIISMMLKRFDEVFDDKMRLQAEKLRLSIPQVVTMASLIEREAKISEERPRIAGVFYNRIKKNMRLESCATVQYVLGKTKPVLLYEDLKIPSPYNTYRNSGLPPGPIASPGKASLFAALSPDKTAYLYFVAKSDGSHYFSKTLAEHNNAKRKYLH